MIYRKLTVADVHLMRAHYRPCASRLQHELYRYATPDCMLSLLFLSLVRRAGARLCIALLQCS